MKFQAGQSSAQRALQMYLAQMQENLERESMALRNQPTTEASPQAQQFPALYGQDQGGNGAQSYPGLGGDEVSGLMRPGARQYDLPADEGSRFNMDFG